MRTTPSIPASISLRFSDLDLNSLSAIVFSARKGLRSSVFYEFAEYIKMSEKSLAALLNLSARTVSNYKIQKRPLEPVQSEHLLKLIALFSKGESLFGNVGEFNYWLNKPFWNATEKPIDWLVTPGGVDLVADELDRLAHSYAV